MSIRPEPTIMRPEDYLTQANDWAKWLERRRAERTGEDIAEARAAIANQAGVAVGTLKNLRENRLKDIGKWVWDRINALVVRELRAEIVRLEHELRAALDAADGPDLDEISQVVADLQKAKAALQPRAGRTAIPPRLPEIRTG